MHLSHTNYQNTTQAKTKHILVFGSSLICMLRIWYYEPRGQRIPQWLFERVYLLDYSGTARIKSKKTIKLHQWCPYNTWKFIPCNKWIDHKMYNYHAHICWGCVHNRFLKFSIDDKVDTIGLKVILELWHITRILLTLLSKTSHFVPSDLIEKLEIYAPEI